MPEQLAMLLASWPSMLFQVFIIAAGVWLGLKLDRRYR